LLRFVCRPGAFRRTAVAARSRLWQDRASFENDRNNENEIRGFEVTDFDTSEHGVTGYLRTWSGSLNEYGRFAAVKF
jgi:hypothetical protein